jgi:LPS-assembly protein
VPFATSKPATRSPVPGPGRRALGYLCAAAGLLAPTAGLAAEPGDAALPTLIEADAISGTPGQEARAQGAVELRRGGLTVRADSLTYTVPTERARAEGGVVVTRDGNVFRGPVLDVQVDTFEGRFDKPSYELVRRKAGGRAEQIDFESRTRFTATAPDYTSCTRDGAGTPDWLLTAERLRVDLDADEAVAENARLRFLGVPVLYLPRMTFPISDNRKSGWLSPQLRISSQSGFEVGVPYYWNAAPNRDLTLTPRLRTRRGAGFDAEVRYLEPQLQGSWTVEALPRDRVTGSARAALHGRHTGALPRWAGEAEAPRYEIAGARVSDDDWWRDFDTDELGPTPRLLPLRGRIDQALRIAGLPAQAYAQAQRWQALQAAGDTYTVPYQRALQAGLRLAEPTGRQPWAWAVETELNRFTLPDGSAGPTRPTGERLHLLAEASLPWRHGGLTVTSRAGLNVAAYSLDQALPDGRRGLARAIPSFSIESALSFERELVAFGRPVLQTLEPRLLYAYTPLRSQSPWLAFDSAPVDFGFSSIFASNDFSGVDRVSDANRINAGLVSRIIDASQGTELMRLGVVQRYLLQDQQLTPQGAAQTERFSDVLLLGETRVIPQWTLGATLRWNAQAQRPVRSVLGVGYSPGPGKSLSGSHRYVRDASEQIEVGGQWPLYGWSDRGGFAPGCTRRWSGIGRADYNLREQRLTSTTFGLEVDATCWKGRLMAQRTSTGVNQFATQVQFQIELTGLTGPVGGVLAR